MLPSSGYTCRAHNSGRGCHIVPFAWERRSRLKGIGHGDAPTPTVGSSRGGLLGLACAVVPWLTWVPALAERLGENSWARASVLLVKKIGQWELSLEVNRSTRALPKISQILWIVSRWSVHSSEETLFLDHMSAPWFILPSTCVAFSVRRLFWAHTRRSFTSVQSRFETRPPWWFMYDTTDQLSERISTLVPECPAERIDRPDTLLAFLGSWCADSADGNGCADWLHKGRTLMVGRK